MSSRCFEVVNVWCDMVPNTCYLRLLYCSFLLAAFALVPLQVVSAQQITTLDLIAPNPGVVWPTAWLPRTRDGRVYNQSRLVWIGPGEAEWWATYQASGVVPRSYFIGVATFGPDRNLVVNGTSYATGRYINNASRLVYYFPDPSPVNDFWQIEIVYAQGWPTTLPATTTRPSQPVPEEAPDRPEVPETWYTLTYTPYASMGAAFGAVFDVARSKMGLEYRTPTDVNIPYMSIESVAGAIGGWFDYYATNFPEFHTAQKFFCAIVLFLICIRGTFRWMAWGMGMRDPGKVGDAMMLGGDDKERD